MLEYYFFFLRQGQLPSPENSTPSPLNYVVPFGWSSGGWPTGPSTILEPQDQEIGELFFVQKHRTMDFKVPNMWKGWSGANDRSENFLVWLSLHSNKKNPPFQNLWKLGGCNHKTCRGEIKPAATEIYMCIRDQTVFNLWLPCNKTFHNFRVSTSLDREISLNSGTEKILIVKRSVGHWFSSLCLPNGTCMGSQMNRWLLRSIRELDNCTWRVFVNPNANSVILFAAG